MNIFGKSLVELKSLLDEKKISSSELVSHFMSKSKEHNPELNAYVTINENAVQEASSAHSQGLLAGLPLAIKDNFCTKGLRTTASAKILESFVPEYDSTVTAKLKKEGAIFTGKTNLDAWAHGSSTETSDFGASCNPWDVTRAPGGSSGGTGSAVGAYLAPAGIGSETAGSIRQPAAWCGIVGLKPTYGRVSRYGAVAMASSLDCPGPMTLTVEDSALLLQAIAGKDLYDATTADVAVEDYRANMKEKKTFTIGVADEYFEGVDDESKQKVWDAIKILEKQGHTVKKVRMLSPKYSISVYTIIQRAEVSSNLGRYTGIRYGLGRENFGKEAKKRVMLGTYTLSQGHYDALYKKAQQVKTLIIEDFKRIYQDVDVIISPTTPITALKLGEFANYPFFGEVMDQLQEPSSVAGIPGISIPVGLDKNGLPIGLQIMGNYFAESTILNAAYQLEQELRFLDVWKKHMKKYQ